jgi:hypothetical protein
MIVNIRAAAPVFVSPKGNSLQVGNSHPNKWPHHTKKCWKNTTNLKKENTIFYHEKPKAVP